MSVIDTIVAARRERIARQGHEMGADVPARRAAPTVRLGDDPFLVCEVKRRSPSRGDIAPGLDATAQARVYADLGVRSISVLTEQDHFAGSLEDLMQVKKALPNVALLRKDFLVDLEDVEVSWRAGADAVLLIASMLDGERLSAMYRRARELGMEALVEVHGTDDVDKCRAFRPSLTGVNCRDLSTFTVDPLHALSIRPQIDWDTRLLFESGIRHAEDVRIARAAGFDGVLVGESVVKDPARIRELAAALREKADGRSFWTRIAAKRARAQKLGRPLVKVCGITRVEDAGAAAGLGADLLGFVFAPSPRRAQPALLHELRSLDVLKVAVVTEAPDAELQALLAEGLVDAVQLHGSETPEQCANVAFPYYKALRLREPADAEAARSYRCPRVLVDAFSPDAAGGTGRRVPLALARAAAQSGPLWLAGGLGPDNVAEAVRELSPELIDASSGLEESPGCKSVEKLTRFFKEIGEHGKV